MSAPETDLLLHSRRVVTPEGERDAVVAIRDGRIAALLASDDPRAAGAVELGDVALLPGLVDTHVHMNDPGRTEWEGFVTATRAAAAGGVTTLVDMPLNAIPATTDTAALAAKRAAARGVLSVDVGYWGGVVPGNAHALEALAAAGVLGFKCFLSPSGVDEFGNVSEADLELAAPALRACGLPLLVHAEDPAALRAVEAGADPRAHATWLASRPPAAEVAACRMLGAYALRHGLHVHVVHVACGEAVSELGAWRARGARVTLETCPHYLSFAAEDIADGATEFKCAPPIRERAQRDALWRALLDGAIDLVASDHSPCPPALKGRERGDFLAAWGGIASLQTELAAVWTGAQARGATLGQLVQWMATAPAALAGLAGRKGAIVAGADADLVAFDPDGETVCETTALFQRHPLTPYAGRTWRGRVQRVWLRGACIADPAPLAPPRGAELLRGGA